MLPTTNYATFKDFTMTRVLSTQLLKLEKLEGSWTLATKTTSKRQWNHALWAYNHYQIKSSFSDHVFWFLKTQKGTHKQVQTTLVWTIQDSILFTNNTTLLMIVQQFDPNPILINIDKHDYFHRT